MKKVKYFYGCKFIWNEKANAYFRENTCGSKYYRNGKGEFHNENGPAIIFSDGGKQYWINDERLTEKEFLQWKRNQNLKYNLEKLKNKYNIISKGEIYE